ncbi:histidine phosphatase family protein [Neobacillus sp. SAB-20_R2A]|uniref:histidine phosphatase family protein n=1 Tax=Neobacillus sp. SAB-20_R2A TaxID=3120519 RepID=UPI003C6DD8E5
MEKKVYVIRHCEAEGQPKGAQLTEKGRQQAKELAGFLAGVKIDKIISSPFRRAVQSIEPAAFSGKIRIEVDERLSERILSTKPLEDWQEKLETSFVDLEAKFDGGESSAEAMDRIVSVVKEVLAVETENTLIVTHGNLMSLLLKYFQPNFGFEEWKNLSNPDVYLLTFCNQNVSIKRVWE